MSINSIITIGRQFGSGGRLIGEQLAEELGIPYYDKQLLSIAAQESGISEDLFKSHDEKPTNSFLYSLAMGSYNGVELPLNHKLFLAQFDAIKKVASEGPCVIVGRCADYALEDFPHCINIFIQADIESKIKRVTELYNIPLDKAKETILKNDKSRAKYYNFYSNQKWGDIINYDLVINSGKLGIDNSIKLIKDFITMVELSR